MPVRTEKALISRYLANVCKSLSAGSAASLEVMEWLYDNPHAVGFRLPDIDTDELQMQRIYKKQVRILWPVIRKQADKWAEKSRNSPLPPEFRALSNLAEFYGLDEIEKDILTLAYLYATRRLFENLCDEMKDVGLRPEVILAMMTGVTPARITSRLSMNKILFSEKLLETDNGMSILRSGIGVRMPDSPQNLLTQSIRNLDDLTTHLVGKPVRTELKWEDFDHIRKDRDFVADLIAGAISCGEQGINVLVVGPPGTGKTELCKVIAKKIGARLFSVGEINDNDSEPSRGDRLSTIRMSQRLLFRQKDVAVLFDEMEDVLAPPGLGSLLGLLTGNTSGRTGSKVFQNRLLETNPVPTFWTSNASEFMDPAYVRRMKYVVKLNTPPQETRARIWRRHLRRNRIRLDNELIERWAEHPEITPAIVATAAQAVRLAKRPAADIELVIEAHARAAGVELPPMRSGVDKKFDLGLIAANIDPGQLVRLCTASRVKNPSFCLYGPPGTGKSAPARHIADSLGLQVLQKRTSDLISKWVGESERNIARAFAEARENRAMLIFDEADSLLADRELARHDWERKQVNEMLTWMEGHPYPFVCTTNLMRVLDKAALRRFDHKIAFHFLSVEQARQAFSLYFDMAPPPALDSLRMLTPVDVLVVARRRDVLCIDSADGLVELLKQECALKPDVAGPIGFTADVEAARSDLARIARVV